MQKFPLCNNNLELFLINKKYNFSQNGIAENGCINAGSKCTLYVYRHKDALPS